MRGRPWNTCGWPSRRLRRDIVAPLLAPFVTRKEMQMVSQGKLLGIAVAAALLVGTLSPAQAAPERSGGREAGFSYAGKYAEEVKYLLNHKECPQWKTGPNEDGTPLVPPDFKLPANGAIRDAYIAAATMQAWAAEAYARTRQGGKAENAAKMMMVVLSQAADLCGDSGQVVPGGKELRTAYIECKWLKERNYKDVEKDE